MLLLDKPKRTVSMRPMTFFICLACVIGLSASGTCFIMNKKYHSLLKDRDLTDQTHYKTLLDKNSELMNSVRKLESEYGKLEPRSRDLESRLDAAEQKNMQKASELATLSKDLETTKTQVLNLTEDLKDREQKYNSLKQILDSHLVLEPTWVGSGKSVQALDGNLLVELGERLEDECQKDSAAVGYLTSGTDKKRLCLSMGKPESFKYQGKKYLFTLLESKKSEGVDSYCISIVKE